MEPYTETAKATGSSDKKIIIAICILILVIISAVAVILLSRNTKTDDSRIGYATEANVLLDQESLQAAMDEAAENAANGNVALNYINDAYSENGIDFSCYIANSTSNIYDMFLSIYADAEMTDEIFLSGLVPPGSGFENITLNHALDSGDHTVYVGLTQVADDEDGQQVIKNQVFYTMDFHVE